jgi:hypothetical protein
MRNHFTGPHFVTVTILDDAASYKVLMMLFSHASVISYPLNADIFSAVGSSKLKYG